MDFSNPNTFWKLSVSVDFLSLFAFYPYLREKWGTAATPKGSESSVQNPMEAERK